MPVKWILPWKQVKTSSDAEFFASLLQTFWGLQDLLYSVISFSKQVHLEEHLWRAVNFEGLSYNYLVWMDCYVV